MNEERFPQNLRHGVVEVDESRRRLPKPSPLSLKPDLEEASKRWEAHYEGEIIDRPIVCVTAAKEGTGELPPLGYYECAHLDMDEVLKRAFLRAEANYWEGEAVPSTRFSFGPDEIAVFCGAELRWSKDSPNTNWSVPFVDDWGDSLPLKLQKESPLYQRMLELYRRASRRMEGKLLISPPDLHTNMDLLSAIRGPERLCLDLIDRPEAIDRAMESAGAIFKELWRDVRTAGRMDELGYCSGFYSMEGSATLQCDFSYMISPDMFRRWALPALEEEAEIVRHALYHWDGPGALVHKDALVSSKGLHTLSYVPGAGKGSHIDYLELYQEIQSAGKAVAVGGSPDEIKFMHRKLKPEKTMYSTRVKTRKEAEELLHWFVRNT